MPIAVAPLKGAINPGITQGVSFSEWEAATAAGLDMWRWEQDDYSPAFRAKVLAWYQAHRLVELHSEAAVNAAVERKLRRKSKG